MSVEFSVGGTKKTAKDIFTSINGTKKRITKILTSANGQIVTIYTYNPATGQKFSYVLAFLSGMGYPMDNIYSTDDNGATLTAKDITVASSVSTDKYSKAGYMQDLGGKEILNFPPNNSWNANHTFDGINWKQTVGIHYGSVTYNTQENLDILNEFAKGATLIHSDGESSTRGNNFVIFWRDKTSNKVKRNVAFYSKNSDGTDTNSMSNNVIETNIPYVAGTMYHYLVQAKLGNYIIVINPNGDIYRTSGIYGSSFTKVGTLEQFADNYASTTKYHHSFNSDGTKMLVGMINDSSSGGFTYYYEVTATSHRLIPYEHQNNINVYMFYQDDDTIIRVEGCSYSNKHLVRVYEGEILKYQSAEYGLVSAFYEPTADCMFLVLTSWSSSSASYATYIYADGNVTKLNDNRLISMIAYPEE